MPIFRRKNCIHTAFGIVALCKRLQSTPVDSRLILQISVSLLTPMAGSSGASSAKDDSGSVPLTCRNRFLLNHCLLNFPPHSERYNLCKRNTTSLPHVKQQFVVIHTIRQNEIPALPDSWVTNSSSAEMLYPQKNSFYLYFRKNITRLSVDLLRICQVFLSPVQFVYRWVTTNCCFMCATHVLSLTNLVVI